MPDKPLQIATYAAGASLAAVALVYVFGPTYFLDDEAKWSSRKKSVVGLYNPANDCFINSVLQAFAGLGDLRVYLIKELYRRTKDGAEAYKIDAVHEGFTGTPEQRWRIEALRRGFVSQSLKEMLDKLNERPIYKKTISANAFVQDLESAFGTRISRRQQDAQELLQILAERLCDEHSAGLLVHRKIIAGSKNSNEEEKIVQQSSSTDTELVPIREYYGPGSGNKENQIPRKQKPSDTLDGQILRLRKDRAEEKRTDDDNSFPLEGRLESQVECQTCHFKPKPSISNFVTITLNVPHQSSTTLDSCFDDLLKLEIIDDYICDRCRLEHAIQVKFVQLQRSPSRDAKDSLTKELELLNNALRHDPEKPPQDVQMPDRKGTPKRKIAKHTRISSYPKTLAIHLSRSIFDASSSSSKNMAKVSFPEQLSLGGLLERKTYRLMGLITHRGGHHSGHYETFRRQMVNQPYSQPAALDQGRLRFSMQKSDDTSSSLDNNNSPQSSPRFTSSTFSRDEPSQSSSPASQVPTDDRWPAGEARPTSAHRSSFPGHKPSLSNITRFKRRDSKRENRWWRISDEKTSECYTANVLSMQKEAYLLFYELEYPN